MSEEIRKRGRLPTKVSAGKVRDLRHSTNNVTWASIAKRLGIGVTTAIKLWRSLPPEEQKTPPRRFRIPWWDRRTRKDDPALNQNLAMQGSKVCRLSLRPRQYDREGNEILSQWCCGKIMDNNRFRKSALAVDGFYLRSLCKKCEANRRGLVGRVSEIFMPLGVARRPKGRPPKIVKSQIDYCLDQGQTEQEIAVKYAVSISTVKRVRWSTKDKVARADNVDWANPESYKK